ncbi:MAG: HlyC/CorC family transporter [Clostridia bacterium]|nr:HlyC/CorC family transporter [Clostridia bacterium]
MKNSIILTLGLQFILIFLNAVFACAEIAVISMNDSKLAKMAADGDKRAVRLARLTSQPARFLATIQVAITLSGFLGSAFAAENFSGVLVEWLVGLGVTIPRDLLDTLAVVLITIVLSYLTLIFGELVPKQVAMRKAETLALGMSGFISGVAKVFAPLVGLLTLSTNGILRLFGIDPNAKPEEVGEEEIRMMVDIGSETGTIDSDERDFIQNVFEFDNLTAEDILTHRTEVTMLDMEDSVEQWDELISETGYTYYPIYQDTRDQVVGVLNSKVYFRLKDKSKESVLENAVNPAYFVPDTLKADVLFQNMKKKHVYFAVVLDEFGGLSGIITVKNLLEELVGDLEDDVVEEESDDIIVAVEEGVWRVGGSTLIEELEEALQLSLADEEYDTVNGMVFYTLGAIPEVDNEIENGGIHIRVTEVENNQVKTALVTKTEQIGE